MNTIDIFKNIQVGTVLTDLYFDNNIIAVKNNLEEFKNTLDSNQKDYIISYNTLYKINNSTGKSKKLSISKPINAITFNGLGDVLYYASFEYTDKGSNINFFKFLCDSEQEQKICSLPLSKNHLITKDPNQLAYDSFFYGISDRYALFGYSEKQRQYGDPNFGKILLIDSEEEKIYVVNPKIDINDTLLRLDMTGFNVFSYNSKLYFTVKTGAIFTYEKQAIFDQQKKDNNFKTYSDELETLAYFEVDDFVKGIKENSGKICPKIIDNIDMYGSMEFIGIQNSEVIYEVTNFNTEICTIKKYNILNHSYEMYKKEKPYNQVLSFNNNIYGVLASNKTLIIDNIITNKEFFRYHCESLNLRVIYIDEQVVVFWVVGKDHHIHVVICNVQTGEIINSYEDRDSEFIKNADTLALYKTSTLI